MSLGYEVLRYVDRCFRNPTDAGDPRLLKRLESYAKEAFEGIVALHAPASPMTWEINTIMVGSVQTSVRQSFRFPRPVEIVGFMPTGVVATPTAGGAVTPSTDTTAVQIDTNNQASLTSADGVSSPAGGKAQSFVTLSAMGVQVPRIVGYKLRNPTPDIGFTFRWKQDVAQVVGGVYSNCMVSMAIYARYL